ncbi:MAG TPA: efflux RND transporter periplasmic adaptor subunit [Patescibacteria group bacterium]|nr:efflux RND transporter periplasmic adaptor subunit [Patescibacteria group bacterium]
MKIVGFVFGFIKRFITSLIKRFKALSRKKKILVIVVAIILLFFVIPGIINANKKPDYESAIVSKKDITEVVTETGTIAISGKIDIQSPTNGVVTEIFVKNDDVVKKGQVLFAVESSATEQETQQAYSAYLTATSAYNSATSALHSLRSSMYTDWDVYYDIATGDQYENSDGSPKNQERESAEFQIAQDNWKAAEKQYKDQQNAVAQAQTQVNATRIAYQATQNATVKATLAGKVSNLAVTTGSGVKAATAISSPKPVLTISSQGSTEVIVSLSESDIAKITEGQEVAIEVNAINDKEYMGIVRRVDALGTDDGGVIRYNVYIEVTDVDSRIRSGMTVDVDIITKKLNNVLSVPNAAVKPYQGGRAVRIYDAGKRDFVYQPVKVGIRGESRTQILEGVAEGQEVVTSLSNEQLKRPGPFGN